jgi:large subunit ribosomal protein L24e
MHKKGITEEVAKKRSRRAVKHQRGIVGLDLASIAAKRNQTAAERQKQRLAAISKAKSEKKEKESKKAKVCNHTDHALQSISNTFSQPATRPVVSGPKVSKQQMKGGKGGR